MRGSEAVVGLGGPCRTYPACHQFPFPYQSTPIPAQSQEGGLPGTGSTMDKQILPRHNADAGTRNQKRQQHVLRATGLGFRGQGRGMQPGHAGHKQLQKRQTTAKTVGVHPFKAKQKTLGSATPGVRTAPQESSRRWTCSIVPDNTFPHPPTAPRLATCAEPPPHWCQQKQPHGQMDMHPKQETGSAAHRHFRTQACAQCNGASGAR